MKKEKIQSIVDWWPSFFATISMGLGLLLNISDLKGLPWNVWGAIAFVVFQNCVLNSRLRKIENISTPIIYISDYDVENKQFGDNEWHLAPYIEVACKNANADNVYPTIEWLDVDNKVFISNQGRWWVATDDLENNRVSLQTVSLKPNGMPRKLHFGKVKEDGILNAWYRTQDGREHFCPLENSPSDYKIRITLKSSNKGLCVGNFVFSKPTPEGLKMKIK